MEAANWPNYQLKQVTITSCGLTLLIWTLNNHQADSSYQCYAAVLIGRIMGLVSLSVCPVRLSCISSSKTNDSNSNRSDDF